MILIALLMTEGGRDRLTSGMCTGALGWTLLRGYYERLALAFTASQVRGPQPKGSKAGSTRTVCQAVSHVHAHDHLPPLCCPAGWRCENVK